MLAGRMTPLPSKPAVSLSTRIFLAFAVVVAATGASSFYAVATVAGLRHELGFLRNRALPLLDEMRQDAAELHGFDEALQRAAPHDLEWVVRFVPSTRPFGRVEQVLAHTRTLRDFNQAPRLARLVMHTDLPLPELDERLQALRVSTEARDRMRDDPELLAAVPALAKAGNDPAAFDALVAAVQRAVAEHRADDAARVVVELRRIIRHVQGDLDTARRDLEAALSARFDEAARSEENVGLLVGTTSGLALAVAVIMLLAMLASLRPMTALTDVVRRFAAGDRSVRADLGGATEIHTAAAEWNRMADALALREAELSSQREDLAHAERLAALGQLAAQMAHEVRNPLSSIGLNAELLDEELGDAGPLNRDEARALIAAIGSEIERLRVITERYLDRARPVPTQAVDVDLGQLAQSLHAFVHGDLQRRGIVSTLDVHSGVLVDGDAGQLRQALWNLVRNATEAMPEGGPLWLDVYTRSDNDERLAVLAVEDGGPGVPETQREHIFQPFATTKERGTGLGLALVREVALAHHGRIELAPGRHGGGARFELLLPVPQLRTSLREA